MEFKLVGGSVCINNISQFLQEVRSISSAHNTIIQAMDADRVAGEDHIRFAVQMAQRAKESGCCVARDMGIEIMRYASGKRQIGEAFSMGLREGRMNVVFVVLSKSGNLDLSVQALKQMVEEKPVIEYSAHKTIALTEQFSITKRELQIAGEEMIPWLVMERVALVDVLK
ncbi:MAG: KEOPS complex subunit Cgi121 [Methanolobus sp.]|nr:KEOPS complex subunit Cgi121 [Methanolobus sp.]